MSGPIAKRAYICAMDPLKTGKVMVRPDIPTGGRDGAFEGKRVMAYSSEEAAGLFGRGEDGMPDIPWPLTLTLVRQRGHSKVEVNEPMKESETGAWEYHDYRRIDTGIIILMADRSHYDQRVIQDADVVIDQHGAVVKHRTGIATSEPMSAGTELLEQAEPVFPNGETPQERGQRFHDMAARMAASVESRTSFSRLMPKTERESGLIGLGFLIGFILAVAAIVVGVLL